MSPVAIVEPQRDPAAAGAPPQQVSRTERANIDESTRVPVMTFFSTALLWLLVSSVLALINTYKLESPEFLGDWAWLTYGRLRPVQQNALVYGWASLAGIGAAIWVMARLCKVRLRYPLIVSTGAVLWNLGVLIGSIGILAGDNTSIKWLEYPSYAWPIIFIGYAAIGIWAVIMYRNRRSGHVFVTQWYLLCAFFCFPWIYATGNLMMLLLPVQGALEAAVHWWYAGNFFGLWLTAIGLGVAYYMIPKVIGRPIYSYHLAAFGFWTFVMFYSWRGSQELVGGPVPAWLVTTTIVATVLTVIPVATVALNQHMTMRGSFFMMHYSPTLRFVVIGAMCYTLASAGAILLSFRGMNRVFQFSYGDIALTQLEVYAFFSMVMFGAMYYIVPRLVGCEWRSAWLVKLHFWGVAYGIALSIIMMAVAGLVQGSLLLDPTMSFVQVIESTLPYNRGRMIAELMLLFGHLVFAFHFLIMIMRLGKPGGTPTLLAELEEQEQKGIGA